MTLKKASPNSGRPVNLYLNPVDEERIADLRAYIAGKGWRVTDSMIVKAALRMVQPERKFLEAFKDVWESDPRRKRE